jgi:hypothetical protein
MLPTPLAAYVTDCPPASVFVAECSSRSRAVVLSTSLSVRISQRSLGGNEAPDTLRMWFALNPTMLNCAHCPRTSGSSMNWLFEQKIVRRFVRRGKSSGSDESALPDRSRISSVSDRSNISRGNSVRPQASVSRWVPASCPARSCSSVLVTVAGISRMGGRSALPARDRFY